MLLQCFSLFSIASITFFIENIVDFKVSTYIYVFFTFVHNGTSYTCVWNKVLNWIELNLCTSSLIIAVDIVYIIVLKYNEIHPKNKTLTVLSVLSEISLTKIHIMENIWTTIANCNSTFQIFSNRNSKIPTKYTGFRWQYYWVSLSMNKLKKIFSWVW